MITPKPDIRIAENHLKITEFKISNDATDTFLGEFSCFDFISFDFITLNKDYWSLADAAFSDSMNDGFTL